MEERHASFLIPIIDGKIWLGQRVKDPHSGKWGAIGGKSELKRASLIVGPQYVARFSCGVKTSVADRLLAEKGLEYSGQTAVREACEELFADLRYPDDFNEGDFAGVVRTGSIDDQFEGIRWDLHFHIGTINRRDLSLDQRELNGFQPLTEINPEDIWPMTKYALTDLKWRYTSRCGGQTPINFDENLRSYRDMNLDEQIPDFKLPWISSSLMGLIFYFTENGIFERDWQWEGAYQLRLREDMPPGFLENESHPELPLVLNFLRGYERRVFGSEEEFQAEMGNLTIESEDPLMKQGVRLLEYGGVGVRLQNGPPGMCCFGYMKKEG